MLLITKQKQSPSKPMENQISLRSLTAPPFTPWSVLMQENIQKCKHELILIAENISQLQPLLPLSDLGLLLLQRCDYSVKEVTKVGGFNPLLLLLVWLGDTAAGLGVNPSVYSPQSLHNNKIQTKIKF